VSDRLL